MHANTVQWRINYGAPTCARVPTVRGTLEMENEKVRLMFCE